VNSYRITKLILTLETRWAWTIRFSVQLFNAFQVHQLHGGCDQEDVHADGVWFIFFDDNVNYSDCVPSSSKQEDATVDRRRTHCCNRTLGATSNARMTSMMSWWRGKLWRHCSSPGSVSLCGSRQGVVALLDMASHVICYYAYRFWGK